MALKGFFDAGRCALGLHQGAWAPMTAGSCTQSRTCSRCAQVDERTEHTWLDWEGTGSPCRQVRTCSQCRAAEDRTVHEGWTWDHPDPAACTERERCAACGTWGDDERPAHEWGEWRYSERHRSPVSACRRCRASRSPFAGHDVEGADEDDGTPPGSLTDADVLAQLSVEFDRLVAEGTIAPERKAFLAGVLAELRQGVGAGDQQQFVGRIKEMLGPVAAMMADPSRPGSRPAVDPDTRAGMVSEVLQAMYATVGSELQRLNLARVTGEAAAGLVGQLNRAREALHEIATAGGDVRALEVETLRPLALDIRRFGLRSHLTFAFPVWAGVPVNQDPNSVFYSGGARVRDLVSTACRQRSLDCLVPQPQREPASLRWEQLRRCAVGVFDFTGFDRGAPLEEAAAVASVAYELGMALAAGRPAVVVAGPAGALPFDVDVEPLGLQGDDGDLEEIGAALDRAVYGVQRGVAGSSVAESLELLRALFDQRTTPAVVASLDVFGDDVAADPVKAARLAGLALDYLDPPVPTVLLPTWPGRYPPAAARQCFHVTAFGPHWSSLTMAALEQACPEGMAYVRGDQVMAPDILRAIWEDIGRSSHIVVDLTGLNANVALELGIAHVLGRNVVLVSQDERPELHFRAIAKYRCHRYAVDMEAGTTDLGAVVARFLAAP